MVQDTIEREITIEAPVERVWAILTEPEHLGTWFGDAGASIELRPGGPMTLTFEGHGTALMEVVAVEPPRRFAYRWAPGVVDTPPTEGNATLVEFTLEARGEGTLLRVLERGFASLAGDGDQVRTGNVAGWRSKLDALVAHAERTAA